MRKISPKFVGISVAVGVVALGAVIFSFVSAAAARNQAKADIEQTHLAEISRQHAQQLAREARLPEVYEFTSAGGKAVTPMFSYSQVVGAQTRGKALVVAQQASGPIIVDQADSGLMPDGFKCQWQTPCEPLASDAAGETLYGSQQPNSFYFYYGLTKGKSIIRITARKALARADVVALANSLKLASATERQHLKVDAQ